jgi:charged multivesicular body protein 7
VQNEAVKTKRLVPLQKFLSSNDNIYNAGWNISPWQLLSAGVRLLGLNNENGREGELAAGQFVVVANIELASRNVLSHITQHSSQTDRIFTKELFHRKFANVVNSEHSLSETDLEVLLKFMSRDKGLLVYDGKTIKIRSVTSTATEITPEDAAVASLKSLIADLKNGIATITTRIEESSAAARIAVEKKNRRVAMASLQTKKKAESMLNDRVARLSQLEDVFNRIQQASDNIEMLKVLKGSTLVLKSLNKQLGGAEKVDEIVDELREEMQKSDEVGNAINELGQESGVITDQEVDEELDAMLEEEKRNEELRESKGTEEKYAGLESQEPIGARDTTEGIKDDELAAIRHEVETLTISESDYSNAKGLSKDFRSEALPAT